ncbi:hypothetical protein CHF27_001815 [Romboutsia maritimum]|uniref:Uncharacterized protein n=1 Tax=Romboutsia maritimum TaxID=2020948 RepID=A0A371IWV3_9FIRM|nr:hypothetical protein [Romboutsia maritimum]RDY24960.1 hypothetical protein CHF27_001815 [Romboutsia maritimum]
MSEKRKYRGSIRFGDIVSIVEATEDIDSQGTEKLIDDMKDNIIMGKYNRGTSNNIENYIEGIEYISNQDYIDESNKQENNIEVCKLDKNKNSVFFEYGSVMFNDFRNESPGSQIWINYGDKYLNNTLDFKWSEGKNKVKLCFISENIDSGKLWIEIKSSYGQTYMRQYFINREFDFNTIRIIIKNDMLNDVFELKNIKINGLEINKNVEHKSNLEIWDLENKQNIREFELQCDFILSKNKNKKDINNNVEILFGNK